MSPGLRARRIQEEHKLLGRLQARNPGVFQCGPVRATDEGDEIEASLSETSAIVNLEGDPAAIQTAHTFRLRFPRFFPGVPLEAWLERPVFHPNIDPETGFVCLWTRTSVGDTAVEAVRRLHKILSLEMYNAEADHLMQPAALAWLQDGANAALAPLPRAHLACEPSHAAGAPKTDGPRRRRLEPL